MALYKSHKEWISENIEARMSLRNIQKRIYDNFIRKMIAQNTMVMGTVFGTGNRTKQRSQYIDYVEM